MFKVALALFGLISGLLFSPLGGACIGGSYAVKDGQTAIGGLYAGGFALKGAKKKWEDLQIPLNQKVNVEIFKNKNIQIKVVYVKTPKGSTDVAATYYSVKVGSNAPQIIEVKSNIILDESGQEIGRTRGLSLKNDNTNEPPHADETYGCGGGGPSGDSGGDAAR